MSQPAPIDATVGRIAGAIYSDINDKFPQPPLVLVPPITFKIRRILSQITDLRLLSEQQRRQLANDIEVAIIPMLFSYEVEADVIEQIGPVIESAAYKALMEEK